MHYQSFFKIAFTGLLLAATPTLAEYAAVYYESTDCSGDPMGSSGGYEGRDCDSGAIPDGAKSAGYYKGPGSTDGNWVVEFWTSRDGCSGEAEGGGETTADEQCATPPDGKTWGSLQVTYTKA